MDILQEYVPTLLQTLHTLSPYTQYPLSLLHTLYIRLLPLYTSLLPLITPYIDSLLSTLHTSPAILSLAAIILLLVIALQILSFVRRVMMFWVRVVVRLAFWGAVVLIASVVWQRGVGRTGEDLSRWAGEVGRVWEREYRRWEGIQGKNGGNGGAGGRTNAGSAWR